MNKISQDPVTGEQIDTNNNPPAVTASIEQNPQEQPEKNPNSDVDQDPNEQNADSVLNKINKSVDDREQEQETVQQQENLKGIWASEMVSLRANLAELSVKNVLVRKQISEAINEYQ